MKALLSAMQAAALLRISPRKLWELTNRGDIRRVPIGRRVLYDEDDLVAFVEALKRPRRTRRQERT